MAEINADFICKRLTPTYLDIPAQSVTDREMSTTAAVATGKLKHRFQPGYSQPNTASTTETKTIFVARQIGAISEIVAGSITAAIGKATVTIDLKKNNVSVMTTIITLDNANVARTVEVGVLDATKTTLAIGDWLEIVITATVGTGTLPTGLFMEVVLDMNS